MKISDTSYYLIYYPNLYSSTDGQAREHREKNHQSTTIDAMQASFVVEIGM